VRLGGGAPLRGVTGVVACRSADVDGADGGTYGGSATENGGEEQAVGAELAAGVHGETA
jgi:hypothetical protein